MKKFYWGVSTSSAQVEGAHDQDGKGETIWDYYSKRGAIYNGEDCFTTCDCYNRTAEDIELMKKLGVNAYRFSLAWARMMPKGYGEINQKGIDFYSKFVDDLLAAGIEPFVTVYHWDMPLPLFEQGGFSNRDIIYKMEDYASLVGKTLGDRVKYFAIFNEPECVVDFMYRHPIHDGVELPRSRQETFEAMHNILLCNGLATRSLRAAASSDVKVGIVSATDVCVPNTPKDVEAARIATFTPREDLLFDNAGFLDPICFGRHYEPLIKKFELDTSFIKEGDMEIIKCNPDFIGSNIYTGTTVEFDQNKNVVKSKVSPNSAYASNLRRFVPESVYYGPKFLSERYNLPVYITENGVALSETLDKDGNMNDDSRVEYIRTYLEQVDKARKDGVDLNGYFYWSMFDNFEWKAGFWPRFGIIHVDYDTFKRTPKKSFYKYQEYIKQYKTELD